jgi:hypothetical protein
LSNDVYKLRVVLYIYGIFIPKKVQVKNIRTLPVSKIKDFERVPNNIVANAISKKGGQNG